MTAEEQQSLIAAARRIVRAFEIFPLPNLIDDGDVLPVARGLLALLDTGPDADSRAEARMRHAPTVAKLADPLTARYERVKADYAQAGHDRKAAEMREPYTAPPVVTEHVASLATCSPAPPFDGSTWAGEPRRAGRVNESIPNQGDQ